MGEKTKNKFDAFGSIRDHAWREFEDKARTEWRLRFGIWGAALASAGALVAAEVKPTVNEGVLLVILAMPVILHAVFLCWIQDKLNETREIIHEAQRGMQELLELELKGQHTRV